MYLETSGLLDVAFFYTIGAKKLGGSAFSYINKVFYFIQSIYFTCPPCFFRVLLMISSDAAEWLKGVRERVGT